MSYFNSLKTFVVTYKWYVIPATLAIVGLGGYVLSGSDETVATEAGPREVTVARIADLMSGGNSLSVVADIKSVNEAEISTEIGGRITRVRASLGDVVGAGQVLAEIENSSQRAVVLQAEGSLDAAKASRGSTQGSSVSTLLTAYAAVNSAIEDAVGQMVAEPESSQPRFTVSSRDTAALSEIESMRPRMRAIMKRQEAQALTISSKTDLAGELELVEPELREVRVYLDIVIRALNAGVARDDMPIATISGYIADVTAARTSVTASLSSVSAARNALPNADSGVSSSEAAIKQAEGAYNAALASLEKTIIRSPISGTLNNFTIKLGDFVSPTQQVAVVSNNGALEAIAYVSEEDKSRIAVGQKVTLEGDLTGTITRIAPALDPVTRRIEVRIGLPAAAMKVLTNGQSVRVELSKSGAEPVKPTNGIISIPITALKMEANRNIVFSVFEGKLAAHEITIGKLSGEYVQVTQGLTADSEIVVDARGLKEGDEVAVK